jgi:chemotaxis signal transduction protein
MSHELQLEPVAAPDAAEHGAGFAAAQECLTERQYCIFRAGRQRYCLSVLEVEEVVEWPAITPVPLAPKFLLGVFNLRGVIVPILDIACAEGRRPDLLPKHLVVASVRSEADRDDLRVGLAADEVIGTYSTTEPLLVEEAPHNAPHCCAMLRLVPSPDEGHSNRFALALDLRRLAEAFPIPVI